MSRFGDSGYVRTVGFSPMCDRADTGEGGDFLEEDPDTKDWPKTPTTRPMRRARDPKTDTPIWVYADEEE